MNPARFYRTYIKPRKDLREVDLPSRVDPQEIRIEKTMFANDVRLYYWKDKHIQCKSEIEARYFKVWLKHGLTAIEIPADEKYLAEIVPILEKVEKNVYEVAEEKLAGYREKTQQEIIDGVFLKVHETPPEYDPKNKRAKKPAKTM
ncbi:hypothetical protein HY772_03880 [Candidatus Woesearchaeota archaeon]|nr:hypothetical protein [Candidatus Woesearchaeota archaeon]